MSGQGWLILWTAVTAIATTATALAVWRQERAVDWRFVPRSEGRHELDRVVNFGRGTARKVHLHLGSASDPNHRDRHAAVDVERVGRGEAIPFLAEKPFTAPRDYSVNLTWRTAILRRQRRWSYPMI